MSINSGDIPSNIPMAARGVMRVNATDDGFEEAAMRKTLTYVGTTDGSGNYTVTYATAFTSTPDVQPQIQATSATDTTTVRITTSSTTSFTVTVRNRTDVLGLLPSYAGVSGASVGVLVTER